MLEMLPYPSGEPHIGHLKIYSVGDAVAHFHRRTGRRVLHPMGYDAFGLPAENHAIRTGQHPRDIDERVDRRVPAPVPRVGHLDRLVARVRHARAALLPLDAVDLPAALRARAWPTARRRRSSGARTTRPCWPTSRSSTAAASAAAPRSRSRQLEQWFFRITDYADRLLDDLDTIEWPEHVKTMQRNWIGRSEGAEVDVPLRGARHRLPGLHDAPGHAVRRDVLRHGARAPRRLPPRRGHRARGRRSATTSTTRSRESRRGARRRRQAEDRRAARAPRHQPGQRRADADVRRRLRADGVRHRRDHGRARPRRARLRVRPGVRPADQARRRRPGGRASCRTPATGRSSTRHPDFDGLHNREALERDRRVARPRGQGPRERQLPPARLAALAPALLGLPDPDRPLRALRHACRCPRTSCRSCCPTSSDYTPQGPLAAGRRGGLGATRPARRAAARRGARPTRWTRSSTRPGTSCATATPTTTRPPWDPAVVDRWMPVDQYIGGVEHAILHLLYARFFTKALGRPRPPRRAGAVRPALHPGHDHPRRREDVQVQGQRRLAADLRRALRRGHRARCYILFIGPPDQDADWSDEGVEGVHRFLGRLWRAGAEAADDDCPTSRCPTTRRAPTSSSLRKAHWAIEKVTDDMAGRFAFNTAIAAVMELVNEVYAAARRAPARARALRAGDRRLAAVPVRAAHRRRRLRAADRPARVGGAVARAPTRPTWSATLRARLPGQRQGARPRRRRRRAPARDELERAARGRAEHARRTSTARSVVKEIVVPGKLVNVVVR